jgi:hypothetical protein
MTPPVPTGTGGTPNVPAPASCEQPQGPVAPAALLTRAEYDNTVEDLLGDSSRPASNFPPENQVDGFNNNVVAHQSSPLLVQKYLEAAEALVVAHAAKGLQTTAPCAEVADERACGKTFVQSFGKSAFRRPLTPLEAQIFDGLFERGYAASGYAFGVQLVMTAMLQSPQFLYRTTAHSGIATAETGAIELDSFEYATRLSYFLTGSMPDKELMDAATYNQLGTDILISNQVRRLLKTERAKHMVREFHHQWLKLDSLPGLTRLASDLGNEAIALGPELLGSIDRFVDYVYFESGKVDELFASKKVFVSAALAPLYGVSAPESDFAVVELPDRAGLLTQPALLTLLAHPDQTAPVLRGVFVRQRMMCLDVPPPPPGANTIPPDPDPNATTRERFRQHTADPGCAGCHKLFDGLGFGLEAYDQLGRYRTTENGIPVDSSGEIFGSGALGLDSSFDGAAELSERLQNSQDVRDCLATTWYRYAVGRTLTAADTCSLDRVKAAFNQSSGDFQELLIAIAMSDGFRYRAPIAKDLP